MNKNLENYAYSLFAFLMYYSVNLLIIKSLNFELSILKISMVSIVIWMFIYFVIKSLYTIKNILLVSIPILFTFLLILLPKYIYTSILFLFPNKLQDLKFILRIIDLSKLKEFLEWNINYFYFSKFTEIPKNFELYSIIIVLSLIAVLFSFLIVKRKKSIYFLIPILYFIIQWFGYVENVLRYFNIYILGLIPIILINNYKKKISAERESEFNYSKYTFKRILTYSLSMGIMFSILANTILIFTPLDLINDKLSSVISKNSIFRTEYSIRNINNRYTFLRESGKLGGPLDIDNTVLMLVESNEKVYLRGRVNNIYTGQNWESDNTTYYRSNKNFLVDDYNKIDKENKTTVKIFPTNIDTTTIFSPYIPLKVEIGRKKIYYNKDYELYYEDNFIKTKFEYYIVESLNSNEFEMKNEFDKKVYIDLPNNLPERVRELAINLTKNEKTDYEKMKNIESFLANNYSYSRIVNNIGDNVDFVDYFLFEERRGYCTYYATALAVMGRTIGVPTRYVEGFVFPEDKNADGLYEITANEAHAWVEAYIEGKGWIKFEPTSPYNSDFINEQNEEDDKNNENDKLNKNNNLGQEKEDELLDLGESLGDNNIGYYKDNKYPITLFNSSIFIISSLLLVLCIRIISIKNKLRTRDNIINNREKGIKYLYHTYNMFSYLINYDINYDVEDLIINIYKYILNTDVNREVISVFNRVKYSNEEISDYDIDMIHSFVKKFEELFVNRFGKIRFLFHRYILNKM